MSATLHEDFAKSCYQNQHKVIRNIRKFKTNSRNKIYLPLMLDFKCLNLKPEKEYNIYGTYLAHDRPRFDS